MADQAEPGTPASFAELFRLATGGRDPYPYQRRLAEGVMGLRPSRGPIAVPLHHTTSGGIK